MQEAQNCFDNVIQLIEQQKLKSAFDLLMKLLSYIQDWQLQEKLDSLRDIYKTMLHYLAENIKDNKREKIYQTLLRSLYQIADIALWQIKSANDSSLFYDRRRAYHHISETSEELINALLKKNVFSNSYKSDKEKVVEKECLNRKIFQRIWLSDHWTMEEKNKWTKIIDQSNEKNLSCLIVTALTLNLLETFDEKKAILLLEAAQNEYNGISERALVGIIIFLRKYNNRLHLYIEVIERLNCLGENPKFIRKIRQILLQFISSKETEKITRKITDELIPEIIQKVGTKNSNKSIISDLLNDSEIEDKNPEWHNLIEKSDLEGKLQKISEWQTEGADVMHSSFIHLKNYPFFREISNWFIPFTAPSEAIDDHESMQLVNILKTSTFLCNSDKYSFYLSISQMSKNVREIMIKQFTTEVNSMKDVTKEDFFNASRKINHFTRQYIQDLYRFYKLHPKKQNFEDIFEVQPEFYKVPFINKLIGNKKDLFIIGEYYFNKNYFEIAADIYDKLLQIEPNSDVLYQKKGYCLQVMGQLFASLNAYQKAELLNTSNSWTLKKMAHLHRVLKNPKEALFYYKKAEQLNPENLSIQLNIGHCYLEIGEFEQALKHYFKVEYLTENKEKVWRPIAWCSLLTNRYQQAINYFNKIIEKKPTMMDYFNAGHAQLAIKNIKGAINLYRITIEKWNCSYEEFTKIFFNDVPHLVKAGIKTKNIPFIIDACYLL